MTNIVGSLFRRFGSLFRYGAVRPWLWIQLVLLCALIPFLFLIILTIPRRNKFAIDRILAGESTPYDHTETKNRIMEADHEI